MMTAPVDTESTDPRSCVRAAEQLAPVNVESGPASEIAAGDAGELELLQATSKSAAPKNLFIEKGYEHFAIAVDDLVARHG